MFKFINTPLIALCVFVSTASALYPIPEYEMVVIESVSKDVTLDMSFKQIQRVKESSSFQDKKQLVYDTLVENISPLLSEGFSDGYNLLEFASTIPTQKILDQILNSERGQSNGSPTDFIILVAPKLSSSMTTTRRSPYMGLYSKNKAAVIDNRPVEIPLGGYEGALNERIQQAIDFAYRRNFVELESNEAFFVGALIHLHLNGDNSRFKIQVAGGLPVNMEMPFEDDSSPEVHFKKVKSPLLDPAMGYTHDYHAGAVVEANYLPGQEKPLNLRVKFGELGEIKGNQWVVKNDLSPFDPTTIKGFEFMKQRGVFNKPFNVPHLWGELQNLEGFWLSVVETAIELHLFNLKVNLHEVDFNIETLMVEGMRTTVELEYKYDSYIMSSLYKWPTVEVPFVTEQVLNGANDAIEPVRKEIQFLIENGTDIVNNPLMQEKLMGIINQILENKTGNQNLEVNSEGRQ